MNGIQTTKMIQKRLREIMSNSGSRRAADGRLGLLRWKGTDGRCGGIGVAVVGDYKKKAPVERDFTEAGKNGEAWRLAEFVPQAKPSRAAYYL